MADAAEVEFRSDDNPEPVLYLGYAPDDGDCGSLTLRIRADGLSYDETALSLRGDGLDTFLSTLASDWRGWEGVRTWDALENGVSVHATHHGNRVELLFIVRRDYKRDRWEVRFPIFIAPGEALSRLARVTARLLDVQAS